MSNIKDKSPGYVVAVAELISREQHPTLWAMIDELRAELAAAQAREAQLREWLGDNAEHADDCIRWSIGERGCTCGLSEALIIPFDDTALRERLKAERERCAQFVEDKFDFCGDEIVTADAIRNLGDE